MRCDRSYLRLTLDPHTLWRPIRARTRSCASGRAEPRDPDLCRACSLTLVRRSFGDVIWILVVATCARTVAGSVSFLLRVLLLAALAMCPPRSDECFEHGTCRLGAGAEDS